MKKHQTEPGMTLAVLLIASVLTAGVVSGEDTESSIIDETVCDTSLQSHVCTAWTARYDGPNSGHDIPHAIDIDPKGDRIFVGGRAEVPDSAANHAVIAYDARSGRQLWEKVNDQGEGQSVVLDLATNPDGTQVFAITITRSIAGGGQRYFDTLAYDATDGEVLWTSRYQGPGDGNHYSSLDTLTWRIAASPDGSKVFVTGESYDLDGGNDFVTIAYDAADGRLIWTDRYDGPLSGEDMAHDLVMDPSGGTVYVTGRSLGTGTKVDFVTIAYNAESGDRHWIVRYDGPDNGADVANAIVMSPDGLYVYVTGHSSAGGAHDFTTLKYRSEDGDLIWESRYDPQGFEWEIAADLAIAPDGGRLFVTGYGTGLETGKDMVTVAIESETGTTVWATRFDGNGGPDEARAIGVSPDGNRVFVVGSSWAENGVASDSITVAYNSEDGSESWSARSADILSLSQLGYSRFDRARDVVVHPDGSMVYVVSNSRSDGDLSGYNFRTLAYGTVTPPGVLNDPLHDLPPAPLP